VSSSRKYLISSISFHSTASLLELAPGAQAFDRTAKVVVVVVIAVVAVVAAVVVVVIAVVAAVVMIMIIQFYSIHFSSFPLLGCLASAKTL
jgi:hypothetical protein